jgi:uncharacterized repeat protein (TIGR03837 family)
MRWDIFCAVIDNFGDIGICWRLARQLAAEHGIAVRLWVDDLPSLQRLCPEADPQAPSQSIHQVEIRHWPDPFPDPDPADVVIEAFGCALPENYLDAMARRTPRPVWINLEYLSAENWVEGCHGMASPHPRLPLTKHFFFPGFTPATGGLLREAGLAERRIRAQESPAALWQKLQLPPPQHDETTVSLFCYDTAPVGDLLAAWSASPAPVRCLLPEGRAMESAAAWFGLPAIRSGEVLHRGSLTLQVIPFLRQEDYDCLLWACDCNFVRGEDSFVRAQWAGRPMVWQIYVQEKNAHLVKLDAFMDRYCAGMDAETAAVVRAFHHGWNNHGKPDWAAFRPHLASLHSHAQAWASRLSQQSDLTSNLVIFCANRV